MMTSSTLRRRKTRRLVTSLLTSAALIAGLFVDIPAVSAGPGAPRQSAASGPADDAFEFTSRYVEQHGSGQPDKLRVDVGSKQYELADTPRPPSPSCNVGYWYVVLRRSDLRFESKRAGALCDTHDVASLREVLGQLDENDFVVLNTWVDQSREGAQAPKALDVGSALSEIGVPAADVSAVDLRTTTLTLLGVRGGQAQYSMGSVDADRSGAVSPTSLRGELLMGTSDGRAAYSLAHIDDATYNVSAKGEITINGQVRAAPRPLAGVNGYRVLVVHRRTLKTEWDRVYDTHDKLRDQIQLEQDLTEVADKRKDSAIVFLATLGNPVNSTKRPRTVDLAPGCAPGKLPFQETCRYDAIPFEQKFTVPSTTIDGVLPPLDVTLVGAHGGSALEEVTQGGLKETAGGRGAVVTGTLPVTSSGAGSAVRSGSTLYVHVGTEGKDGGEVDGGDGGYNGGGHGGDSARIYNRGFPGGGGGGATDVSVRSDAQGQTDSSRLAVAAGGGGGGGFSTRGGHRATPGGHGGNAGWPDGERGEDGSPSGKNGGGGATQNTGGLGGAIDGHDGTSADGGAGGVADSHDSLASAGGGGGGGGGYYGGGGGGHADTSVAGYVGGGGGGGGSDLLPAGGRSSVVGEVESVPASASFTFLTPYGPTLGDVLRRFGATPTLIQSITSDSPRYALVGSPNPFVESRPPDHGPEIVNRVNPFNAAEASPGINEDATGQLQGALGRGDKNMWFGPLSSNAVRSVELNGKHQPDSTVNLGFYDLLAGRSAGVCVSPGACPEPTERFPYTDPADPRYQARFKEHVKALGALSEQLCGCSDIRTTYGSTTVADYLKKIETVLVPLKPVGYSTADFEDVRRQVKTELADASTVRAQEGEIRKVLDAVAGLVKDQGDDVKRALREAIPDSDGSAAWQQPALLEFLLALAEGILAAVGAHVVAAVVGMVAAAITFTAETVENNGGGAESSWESKADELISEMQKDLFGAAKEQSQLFGLVYANWGMLAGYATNVDKQASGWDLGRLKDEDAFNDLLSAANKLALFRALVPLRFDVAEANGDANPKKLGLCFYVTDDRRDCAAVHGADFGPTSTYRYETDPTRREDLERPVGTGGPQPQLRYMVAGGEPPFTSATLPNVVTPLPEKLVKDMTAVGLYLPYLFLRWPFARKAGLVVSRERTG